MSGVGLVHGGRGDARAAVALEPLLHLVRRRPVGRVGDEEVAMQRVFEGRRPVVRGDREDRTLERRRRLDRALLALWERDEPGVAQERTRALRPFLVLGAHRVGRRRVDLVQPIARLLPRAAVDLFRDAVRLRGEEVPLLAALLSQLSGAKGKALLLAQQRAVELLADGVVAVRVGPVRLEERGVLVERLLGRRAGFREALFRRGVLDLGWDQLARVLGRGLRLTDRALEVDARGACQVEVRDAVADVLRHFSEAGAGRLRELLLRPQAMQEEREDTLKAGSEIGPRLPAPHLERLDQLPAA